MELDKRIMPGKRPLNCFDTEQAEEFIGKKCYFSDEARDFMNLDKADGDTMFYVAELQNIWTAEEYCFADNSNDWRFILPFEWVKPKESKEPKEIYRAFSLNEFSALYAIGDVVTFRLKDREVIEQSMLIGFQSCDDEDIPGNGYVLIGNCRYGFMELFNNYELKYLDHWQPFGVIDE